MNIMKELNTSMNFSYIIESVSNIAFELTKSIRQKENRFNENLFLIEDLKFECENFLYDIKKYPEIRLEDRISIEKHESFILDKFNKKELFIEGNKISFYTLKEDENIILFKDPIEGSLKIRYNNNFINEKSNLIKNEKSDIRTEMVTNFLLKENTCAEVDGIVKILEESNIKIKPIENDFILQENSILYATKSYEDLKELHSDCEIAYNEIIKEGKIIPILTFIDILTEDVEAIYSINWKESYKNHYNYSLERIYNR